MPSVFLQFKILVGKAQLQLCTAGLVRAWPCLILFAMLRVRAASAATCLPPQGPALLPLARGPELSSVQCIAEQGSVTVEEAKPAGRLSCLRSVWVILSPDTSVRGSPKSALATAHRSKRVPRTQISLCYSVLPGQCASLSAATGEVEIFQQSPKNGVKHQRRAWIRKEGSEATKTKAKGQQRKDPKHFITQPRPCGRMKLTNTALHTAFQESPGMLQPHQRLISIAYETDSMTPACLCT